MLDTYHAVCLVALTQKTVVQRAMASGTLGVDSHGASQLHLVSHTCPGCTLYGHPANLLHQCFQGNGHQHLSSAAVQLYFD